MILKGDKVGYEGAIFSFQQQTSLTVPTELKKMKQKVYKKQVALMINIIPEVAKEKCFALHEGTV
jgi:hypothetical protein